MVNRLSYIILYPFSSLIALMHSIITKGANRLMKVFFLKQFCEIGKGFQFTPINSHLTYKKIKIGNNVFINNSADFRGEISIGNNVMFGPYVYITAGRHEFEQVGKLINQQGEAGVQAVIIEDDCWIGARAFISRGVIIGEGTVVGAMSVVTKSLPPYTICVGNPCKPIKKRYSDEELLVHKKTLGYSTEHAQAMLERRQQQMQEWHIEG